MLDASLDERRRGQRGGDGNVDESDDFAHRSTTDDEVGKIELESCYDALQFFRHRLVAGGELEVSCLCDDDSLAFLGSK